MNINRMKYFMALAIVALLTACSSKQEDKAATKTETAKQEAKPGHEEPVATIAALTEEQVKTVGIQLGSIEQKELTATIKVNGALRVPNNNKANATSLYGGVIKTINVQLGDNVSKGQVIATIANPQFIQLQEEYLSTASKITFAEQEVARQKELNSGNAGALRNLQSATADLSALRTRRASLQQQIQLMGIDPESIGNGKLQSVLSVRSPISGTVSNVMSKIGSYVDVSSPVAEVVDNGQLHLDLNVFEKDLPLLKVGQTIHFRITNNAAQDYNAKVYSIGAAFENDSKSIPVHATVQGNKTGLIDGMNITALVSLNDVTQNAVPNDAIVSTMGKDYIFIVTDKKPHEEGGEEGEKKTGAAKKEEPRTTNFERVEIVRGVSNLGYTAITMVSNVPQGAKVVTKGSFFINAKLTNKGEE